MAPNQTIDYDALAKQAGAVSSVDYDALAKQAGAVSSKPASTPPTTQASTSDTPAPERGILTNLIGGVQEGAAKTVTGLGNLIGRGVEIATGQPKGSLQSTFQDNREQPSIARNIGEGAENIGEFAAGDAALEGMAKLAKVPESVLALAEKYPTAAKLLHAAVRTTQAAAVGGAQGGVKGAAENNAAAGAKGGAAGGALGGAIGEAAGAIAEPLAKKFGVGTTAIEDAKMGARPAKRNQRFASDFLKAAPYLDAENSANPAKSIEDWANHAQRARENLFENKVEPLVERNENVPLGGANIANSIRKQIPEAMKRYSAPEAVKMEQLANDFMPQQRFQLNVADAEDALEHFNAKLAATGYWSKMPAERAAIEKTDGTIAGYKAAADAIRDELYGKLDELEPNSNMRGLKQDYGALRNIENEIRGRVNVVGRQSPVSLKEFIGAATGLAHGGPLGAGIAAIGPLDRWVNSPENLIARGVDKAVGNPSAVRNAVSGAIEKAPAAGANIGSQVGQTVAQPNIEDEQ